MKITCSACSKSRGKRFCEIKSGTLICPVCCAEIRNEECDGCSYYGDARKFAREKEEQKEKQMEKKQQSSHFIKRIDMEVDEEVNNALEMAEKGYFIEGEKKLRTLLAANPDMDSIQFGLGVIYILQKRYDEALSHFDKAIKIFPYNVEAWFNKGVIHKEKLEIEKMIEAYQKVVEFGDINDSYVVEATEMLRIIEKDLDKNNMTIDEFIIAGKKFKDGFDYMNKREFWKAIDRFLEVIGIDNCHVQSYGNMGICYAFLGNKQKAIEALDKAIELDPKYMPAIDNKKLISLMEEGEKLDEVKMRSTEYYKDAINQKK